MRMLSLSNVRTSLTVILTLLAISCGGGGGGDDGGDIDTLGQSDLIRNTPTVFNGTAIPVATEPPLTANPAPEQAADLNILLDISGLPGIPGGFYDRVLGLGTLDLSGQNLVASGSSPGFGSFLRNQNFANILRNANPATPFDVFNPFARFEAERFANGLSSATANRSTSMVQAIHAQA